MSKIFLALLFMRMYMISNAMVIPTEFKRGTTYTDQITNNRYRIIGLARYIKDPKTEFVIYEQLFASRLEIHGTPLPYGSLLAGPKGMFDETIDNEQGKKVRRFKRFEPIVRYSNTLRCKL